MRKSLPLALIAAAALCLAAAACGRGGDESSEARDAQAPARRLDKGPVLVVEGVEFSNSDFRAYLGSAGVEADANLPDESLSRLFDRFVDERILLQAARERNISLSEDEKREYLARLATESVTAEGNGAPPPAAPDGLFESLLVEKYTFQIIRDVQVEPAEIEEYYERNKKEFLLPERIRVSQILVDTEEKAVSVLRRLERTGEAEFRKIAREESAGPEASRDGVMGVFTAGDLPTDMERVIFSLNEGRTSQIVESAYGYHIFRLDKKSPPALRSAAEAAPAIRSRILAGKIKEAVALHLEGLKDTLTWRAHTDNLFFSYSRSNG
jgi:parvulin-like peptidyl-prolyl isomerase